MLHKHTQACQEAGSTDDEIRDPRIYTIVGRALGLTDEIQMLHYQLSSTWDERTWEQRAELVAAIELRRHKVDCMMKNIIKGVE